jgi:hypothetical protein
MAGKMRSGTDEFRFASSGAGESRFLIKFLVLSKEQD